MFRVELMKIKGIINSFKYAIDGLLYCVKTQRNMRIHFIIAVATLVLAVIAHVSLLEIIILITVISLVITAEMINTAIEKVVDMVSETYHPLAKIAKNVAAGAVLITAITAVIIGCLIFLDKLVKIISR